MVTSDKILAGYGTVGRYEPIQLYAGENQHVSTQGVLAAGNKVGLLNERNETYKFGLVSEVGGKLVKYDGTQPLKGILPHALDTGAAPAGYNADVDTSVIVQIVANFEAIDTDMDYAEARAAEQAPGTNITFQKLY